MDAVLKIEEIKKIHGKRYASGLTKIRERIGSELKAVKFPEALDVLLSGGQPKFDQTIDLALRLGIDPKQSDQMVRGAVSLPNGLGKTATIVVFAKGEKVKEAEQAGADFVGADDLVEKINGGWQEFTAVIATPDMMGVVSKLGRVLGPRGLMPNPKVGTVTFDVTKAITELKKGRVEFRTDKAGIIHAAIGKASFGKEKLGENLSALVEAVLKMKPSTSKGQYFRSMYLTTTMGPSVRIDIQEYLER